MTAAWALIDGDRWAATVFGATALGAAFISATAQWLPAARREDHRPAATVAFAWLLLTVLGGLPLLWLDEAAPISCSLSSADNALFESFSAFTSTGLSVSCDAQNLRSSVQLWRSLAQWTGGAGMVIFGLLVLDLRAQRRHVQQELSERALGDDASRSARGFVGFYATFTVATVVAFSVSGVPGWEAVNHALTSVSTGGMTVTSDSFSGYGAVPKLVAVAAMLLGGGAFGAYILAWRRRALAPIWRSTQLRAYAAVFVLGIPAMGALASWLGASMSWLDVAFQWTSAMTTCGFSVVDTWTLDEALWVPIVGMMVVGGCAGSTVGGLKLSRVVWLAKQLRRTLTMLRGGPDADRSADPHYDGEPVEADEATDRVFEAGVLLGLWMATLLVGIAMLAALEPSAPLDTVVFDATSALGGVGLSSGFVSAELTTASKFVLCGMMWLGRLEILSVLALVSAPWTPLRRTEDRRSSD